MSDKINFIVSPVPSHRSFIYIPQRLPDSLLESKAAREVFPQSINTCRHNCLFSGYASYLPGSFYGCAGNHMLQAAVRYDPACRQILIVHDPIIQIRKNDLCFLLFHIKDIIRISVLSLPRRGESPTGPAFFSVCGLHSGRAASSVSLHEVAHRIHLISLQRIADECRNKYNTGIGMKLPDYALLYQFRPFPPCLISMKTTS